MFITNYNTYTGYSSERWCTRLLFLVNTLTVFPSFLLYWMRIICCIYKDFVRQLKTFMTSFCHLCACEMSLGWGHLITWMDPSVGHLNGILARVGENLNNNFQKSQMPGGGCWSFDLTDTLFLSRLDWRPVTEESQLTAWACAGKQIKLFMFLFLCFLVWPYSKHLINRA